LKLIRKKRGEEGISPNRRRGLKRGTSLLRRGRLRRERITDVVWGPRLERWSVQRKKGREVAHGKQPEEILKGSHWINRPRHGRGISGGTGELGIQIRKVTGRESSRKKTEEKGGWAV